MERLTKTYSDGSFGVADNLPCGENSYTFKNLLIDRLGYYENADEHGLLLRLPCKVGTHVYRIYRVGKVRAEKIGKSWDYMIDRFGYEYIELYLHGYIALTKEEAEAKLKEMENKE